MSSRKIVLSIFLIIFIINVVGAGSYDEYSPAEFDYGNMSKLYEYNVSMIDSFNDTSLDDMLNNISNKNQENNKLWDKNRPIYFAMDHVDSNDEKIRDTIVNKLKDNGFNVIKAEIGPNTMSQNTLYLYENNITNAVVFHLFNGVDPSTIRELATDGDDNRGKIVRSNGNDVVLAWFYDSADPVNSNGSAYEYVMGSETGSSLENPGQYMKDNKIVGICTSSDMGDHNESADYTGEKTADEFMKLFKENN